MSSKLIEMDGVIFEAEVPDDEAVPLAGNAIDRVAARFDELRPVLVKLCKPFAGAWNEMNSEIEIAEAEISLGISFLGEGNFFISKAQAGANLNVKMVFKKKD